MTRLSAVSGVAGSVSAPASDAAASSSSSSSVFSSSARADSGVASGGGVLQDQVAARGLGTSGVNGCIQQDQPVRLFSRGAQDLQAIAQHQPSGGGIHRKPLGSRLYLDHHRVGQLARHLHHIQIGQLLLQQPGFLSGRETEDVVPLLNAQQVKDLLLGIDAGIGGCGAVQVFHPETGDLEQQEHRERHAQEHQQRHDQHALDPPAAADAHLFHLGDPALVPRRTGAVGGLLRIVIRPG